MIDLPSSLNAPVSVVETSRLLAPSNVFCESAAGMADPMVFELKGDWYVSGAAIGLWGAGCPESIYKDISLPAAQANYRASLYKNYIVRLSKKEPKTGSRLPQLEA